MYRLLYIFLLLMPAATLAAQSPEVSFRPVQDSVLVGDEVVWELQILAAPDTRVEKIQLISWDSIPDLTRLPSFGQKGPGVPLGGDYEILDFGAWEVADISGLITLPSPQMEVGERGDDLLFSNRIRMVFWEEGIFAPSPPVVQVFSSGEMHTLEAKLRPLQVAIPKVEGFEPDSLQLIPVKPVIPGGAEQLPFSYLVAGILLLLILLTLLTLAIVRVVRKRKKKETQRWVKVAPAELALQEIRLLEKPLREGRLTAFSVGLSRSLRRFLERRYQIKALESATEDILRALNTCELGEEQKDLLRRVLQQTDLVKYAKGEMPVENARKLKEESEGFVRREEQPVQPVRIPEETYIALYGQAPPPEQIETPDE